MTAGTVQTAGTATEDAAVSPDFRSSTSHLVAATTFDAGIVCSGKATAPTARTFGIFLRTPQVVRLRLGRTLVRDPEVRIELVALIKAGWVKGAAQLSID
jgi:hypothetical protein